MLSRTTTHSTEFLNNSVRKEGSSTSHTKFKKLKISVTSLTAVRKKNPTKQEPALTFSTNTPQNFHAFFIS